MLTQAINWHWIFFVNIPIGVATAVAGVAAGQRDKGIGLGEGADVPGAVLVTGALMLGVYTIVGRPPTTAGAPAARSAWARCRSALLAAFVAARGHGREPADAAADLPLAERVGRQRWSRSLMVAGLFGMFFLGALYLQRVLGYDAVETGLAFLPVSLVIGVLSLRFSARLIMRFGARATLLPGLGLIALGPAAVLARAGGRQLPGGRAARDAAARRGRGPVPSRR